MNFNSNPNEYLNDQQIQALVNLKNKNTFHKEKRIKFITLSFDIYMQNASKYIEEYANKESEKPIAILIKPKETIHPFLYIHYQGNVIQTDCAANFTFADKLFPIFDTFDSERNSLQRNETSCSTFHLQMAEDLLKHYDKNPKSFPKTTKDQEFVKVPKEVRKKWAVYAQSTDAVSKMTKGFTDAEKQDVKNERMKFPIEIKGKNTFHGWAPKQHKENLEIANAIINKDFVKFNKLNAKNYQNPLQQYQR